MILIIGIPVLLVVSTFCWFGIKKYYDRGAQSPVRVSILIWITDTIHLALVITASISSAWHIPIHRTLRLIGGSVLFGVGLIIMLTGMIQFRSLRRISGMDTTQMMTAGIYKWSRNPQYAGWFMWLLGISLIGQSGLALLLTVVFIIGIHLYNIRLEEPYLERVFGEEFRSYRSKTPRYLGIPRR
jgi:protein-S-isoprenylcysteine O-methyltransferase Ste14